MSRPFAFKPMVKKVARLRQDGVCAVCGDALDDIYEHAHHVIPNQSGQAGHVEHEFLKQADNCVVLCEQCHDRVHADGHYRSGPTAPPSYFVYSHGADKKRHNYWLSEMNARTRKFWKR